jgi:hypothetical protein
VASVALAGAYAVTAATSQPSAVGVLSVLALLAIAGAGLLYAWRLGAGAPVE